MLGSGRWVHAFHTSGDDSDDSTSHIRAPDQQAFIAKVAVSTQGPQDLQVNARREDLVTGELDPSTGLEELRIARVVPSTQGSQGLQVNPRRETAAKARSKRADLRRQRREGEDVEPTALRPAFADWTDSQRKAASTILGGSGQVSRSWRNSQVPQRGS